jgi:hypothetical protein
MCGHARVRMLSSTGSLVIAMKLKAEKTSHGHHVVNLHSIEIVPEQTYNMFPRSTAAHHFWAQSYCDTPASQVCVSVCVLLLRM